MKGRVVCYHTFTMAKEKLVKSITSMDEDFAKWYTDVCVKAELIDYSSVKGCMIIRPYGYAIWENIQKDMLEKFPEAIVVTNATCAGNLKEMLLISDEKIQSTSDLMASLGL